MPRILTLAFALCLSGCSGGGSGGAPDVTSPLPQSQDALLAGESSIGTTLHYISDPGIDTGGIIGHTDMPVSPEHSYLWHVLALYPTACEKLLACVTALAAGDTRGRRTPTTRSIGRSRPDIPANGRDRRYRDPGSRSPGSAP